MHKMQNLQRENEKILEKYVVESSKSQDLSLKIQELSDKIASYE